MQEIQLKDIADELFILNIHTIETLFNLKNYEACIALYSFYYKTAKWQKTNIIKANDIYISKCLKWGKSKITETKKTLKENGLIDIVQRRKNGKVDGWYIQVKYIVSSRNIEDVKVIVDNNTNNPQEQELDFTTSCNQDTNALIKQINALKEENKILKQNQNIKPENDNKKMSDDFELIWKEYPNKSGKSKAYSYYVGWLTGKKEFCKRKTKLTNKQMWLAVKKYADECIEKKRDMQYIQMGSTFFNSTIAEYAERIEE